MSAIWIGKTRTIGIAAFSEPLGYLGMSRRNRFDVGRSAIQMGCDESRRERDVNCRCAGQVRNARVGLGASQRDVLAPTIAESFAQLRS